MRATRSPTIDAQGRAGTQPAGTAPLTRGRWADTTFIRVLSASSRLYSHTCAQHHSQQSKVNRFAIHTPESKQLTLTGSKQASVPVARHNHSQARPVCVLNRSQAANLPHHEAPQVQRRRRANLHLQRGGRVAADKGAARHNVRVLGGGGDNNLCKRGVGEASGWGGVGRGGLAHGKQKACDRWSFIGVFHRSGCEPPCSWPDPHRL